MDRSVRRPRYCCMFAKGLPNLDCSIEGLSRIYQRSLGLLYGRPPLGFSPHPHPASAIRHIRAIPHLTHPSVSRPVEQSAVLTRPRASSVHPSYLYPTPALLTVLLSWRVDQYQVSLCPPQTSPKCETDLIATPRAPSPGSDRGATHWYSSSDTVHPFTRQAWHRVSGARISPPPSPPASSGRSRGGVHSLAASR